MEHAKLSLDNFLEEEKSIASDLLFTIEPDEINSNNVTISLWKKDGCNCSGKISIAKELVESVEKTKDTHYCCGKIHIVVKVNFVKDASISIDDLLEQMATSNRPGTNLMNHTASHKAFTLDDINPDIRPHNYYCGQPQLETISCGIEGRHGRVQYVKDYMVSRDIRTNRICSFYQTSDCHPPYPVNNG